MKLTEQYPIFWNPLPEELINFGHWDTLRILLGKDGILIASGYGNTHTSMIRTWKEIFNVKRTNWDDDHIILHKENQLILNINGNGKFTRNWRKWFTEEQQAALQFLEDLLTEFN